MVGGYSVIVFKSGVGLDVKDHNIGEITYGIRDDIVYVYMQEELKYELF